MEPPPAWASLSTAAPAAALDANQHEQELFAKYSTLNEPVLTTILRDVHAVAAKLRIVLRPLDYSSRSLIMSSYSAVSTSGAALAADNGASNSASVTADDTILSEHDRNVLRQLKDWDLWGPLVVCLGLAVVLSFKAPTNQARLTFAAVFCAFWVGGSVVTINAQLLGGTISFFQSLCVLGYSVFPLLLSATVIGTLKIVFNTWLWLDMVITTAGCLWAMRISSVFVSLYIKPERRALALYPVVFFYTFLAWLILLF
jgi:protein YIPF6